MLLQIVGLSALLSSVFRSRLATSVVFAVLGYLLFVWQSEMARPGFTTELTFWTWLLPATFALAEACRFSISKLVSKQYWSELGPSGGSRQPDEPYHEIHYARDVALNTAVGWHGLPSDVITFAAEKIQSGLLFILGQLAIFVLVVARDPVPAYAWLVLAGSGTALSLFSRVITCSLPGLMSAVYQILLVAAAAAVVFLPSLRDAVDAALKGPY